MNPKPISVLLSVDHIQQIIDQLTIEELEEILASRKEKEQTEFRRTPINELLLSPRAYSALSACGCNTVQDVLNLGKENLPHLKNVGSKTITEIEDAVFMKMRN